MLRPAVFVKYVAKNVAHVPVYATLRFSIAVILAVAAAVFATVVLFIVQLELNESSNAAWAVMFVVVDIVSLNKISVPSSVSFLVAPPTICGLVTSPTITMFENPTLLVVLLKVIVLRASWASTEV